MVYPIVTIVIDQHEKNTSSPFSFLDFNNIISVIISCPPTGQPRITWNQFYSLFVMIANNSLVSLSSATPRVSVLYSTAAQYPLVCEGKTGGQWYQPNGALFPLATPDPITTPGGLGQRNVS